MDFIERHSYALLFAWVLAEQGAVPLPSVPLLLATGALARLGRLQILPAAACCVAAALLADTTWFLLGRRRGKRILHWICRISLEPDSCVRRTQDTFVRYGLRSLLVSKFVPGLNAVAAPLAGSSGFTFWRFLVFDVAGSVIWTAAYLGLGYSVAGRTGAHDGAGLQAGVAPLFPAGRLACTLDCLEALLNGSVSSEAWGWRASRRLSCGAGWRWGKRCWLSICAAGWKTARA